MISDFVGGDDSRRKPKRIEPLEKEPQRSIHELAAEHEASEHIEAQAPAEPSFVPPNEIAETANEVNTTPVETPSQVKSRAGFFSPRWTLSKKWTIAAAVLSLLLVGGGFNTDVNVTEKSGALTVEFDLKKLLTVNGTLLDLSNPDNRNTSHSASNIVLGTKVMDNFANATSVK